MRAQSAATSGREYQSSRRANLFLPCLFSPYLAHYLSSRKTALICPIDNGAAELRLPLKPDLLGKAVKIGNFGSHEWCGA